MSRCECWAHRALEPRPGRRSRAAAATVTVDLPDTAGLREVVRDAVIVQAVEPDHIPDEPTSADTDDEAAS